LSSEGLKEFFDHEFCKSEECSDIKDSFLRCSSGSSKNQSQQIVQKSDQEGQTCKNCPEMVSLPNGILMGKYEITREQWAEFVEATGHTTGVECAVSDDELKLGKGADMNWHKLNFTQTDRDPVVCVNWQDVTAYADWLSAKTGHHYRLPTDHEWDIACLAGQDTKFCGSDNVDDVAWYEGNSEKRTHPVGQKAANAWDLYDMSGNVWEWVNSCKESDCSVYSIRGGSWRNDWWMKDSEEIRTGYHLGQYTNERLASTGFRLIQDH
jgi:formylglycine-generating enzyme required for sulfatase activity